MSLRAIARPPQTGQSPRGLVIILHGWGANARDVAGLADYIDLPDDHLVFPDAPWPHPMAPAGRMWYDLPLNFSFDAASGFGDRADLQTSRTALADFLTEQMTTTGIPAHRTILGGFSQGGAMTLDVGLQQPLAGLMVLSGYLHAPSQATEPAPPVLMVHGRQDPVVPIQAAQQARDTLRSQIPQLHYEEYDMGHEISLAVLQRMQTFVEKILET